jgi:formylglycine-generating enzyme required for sulfatase activity
LPTEVEVAAGRYFWTRDGAEMVFVPEGEFSMGNDGSVKTIGFREADDMPVRRVYASAFLVDRHEVTVGQYLACCSSMGRPATKSAPGMDPLLPVIVTWDEAVEYATWAGKRLPTEAEWEKSARGLDSRAYPWGIDARVNEPGGIMRVGMHPDQQSPYGCLDMVGNAWEWCSDWYGVYDHSAIPRDPRGPVQGTERVVRGMPLDDTFDVSFRVGLLDRTFVIGGSSGSSQTLLPCASRFRLPPGSSAGFRCAISVSSR